MPSKNRIPAGERFGENLILYRRKHRLTQQQLASMLGVTPRYLGDMERGCANLPLSRLCQISQVIALPLIALFDATDSQPEQAGGNTDPEILRTQIGKNVADLRKRAQITQEELSVSVDVTARYISDIEHGYANVTLVRLSRIAQTFDTTISRLLQPESSRKEQ